MPVASSLSRLIDCLTTPGVAGVQVLSRTADGQWLNRTLANAGIEPAVAAGTTGQYRRGDKSWQTLDVAAVSGLQDALTAKAAAAALTSHTGNVSNPHATTANQVLPNQDGSDGYILYTDGTYASWTGDYARGTHPHSEYALEVHTHDYLALSGGTLAGALAMAPPVGMPDTDTMLSVGSVFTVRKDGGIVSPILIGQPRLAAVALVVAANATTWNFNSGPFATLTLAGNCVVTISNPVAAGTYVLRVKNSGAGPYLLTWAGTAIVWLPGGTAPVAPTGDGKRMIVTLVYDGTEMVGIATVQS